jgi:hypothetical protein
MTAEEKSKELFDKYLFKLSLNTPKVSDYLVKECALIAVDEILNLIEGFDLELTYNYYKEVKNEINKL